MNYCICSVLSICMSASKYTNLFIHTMAMAECRYSRAHTEYMCNNGGVQNEPPTRSLQNVIQA